MPKQVNIGVNDAQISASNKLPVTGSVADGGDVSLVATTDSIVAAVAAGRFSAKLRRVTQGLEDLKTLIMLAAGENHIGAVGGAIVSVATEMTRPSDTTAYAAGDV